VGVPVCDTEASTSKGNLAASRGLFFLLGFKGGPGVLVASRGLASGLFEGLLALGSYMGVLILSLLTVVSQEDVGLRRCNSEWNSRSPLSQNVHKVQGATALMGCFCCWGLALEWTPHHPVCFLCFHCEMRHEILLCLG